MTAARRTGARVDAGHAAALPGLSSPPADVAAALGVDPALGLPDDEAARRLARHGRNLLPREPPVSAWRILGRQVAEPMVGVLALALALSLAVGHRVEAAAIGAIAAFTVVLGFLQEHRAARAVDALRRLAAPRANVVRSGRLASIDAEAVVPGDVLVLDPGDIVAADARLVASADLRAVESSLTGESEPVSKDANARMGDADAVGDRLGMVHAGTVVAAGRGRAIVTTTGAGTELGRIGGLLATVEASPTPLQRQLARLARALLLVGAAAVLLVVALGLLRGERPVDMLLFGIAVAVAIVPEALPAVVTISLAIGAQRMARRNAIVRRLPTVETLGSTTVICSDKTGTLTLGQMAAVAVEAPGVSLAVASRGYEPQPPLPAADAAQVRDLALAAALCNDAEVRQEGGAWTVLGDPTEGALAVLAHKAGLDPLQARTTWPRLGEVPFSSERKRMTTLHAVAGVPTAFSKGAPEAVVAGCAFDPAQAEAWLAKADAMAAQGLRVLALASKGPATLADAEAGMRLLGLVGLRDAPRPEAAAAIATCKQAGIRPVLITGDHPRTAAAVATELGILEGGQLATGTDVDAWSDARLAEEVGRVQAYARVSPAHKLRIVTALQAQGHVVAMTGDGVNDAPALRKADIGVAMGITGTEVSKEAAGMILADDDFATIVAAVEEGRAIFANVRKYLVFLLSTNLAEVLLIAATLVAGLPLPLSAVQLLYVNLASDGLPALALAVDPHDRHLMRRAPRRPGQGILDRPVLALMGLAAAVTATAMLGLFLWARSGGRPLGEAMSLVFAGLILVELAKAFVFRALDRPLHDRPFTNRWLDLAILWEVALLLALLHVPFLQRAFGTHAPSPLDWLALLATVATVVLVLELAKAIQRGLARSRAGANASSP